MWPSHLSGSLWAPAPPLAGKQPWLFELLWAWHGTSSSTFDSGCEERKKRRLARVSTFEVPTSEMWQRPFIKFYLFCLCWDFVAARTFLWLWRAGLPSSWGAGASHRGGLSCCRAWALGYEDFCSCGMGLSSCGSRALGHRLSSCDMQA